MQTRIDSPSVPILPVWYDPQRVVGSGASDFPMVMRLSRFWE